MNLKPSDVHFFLIMFLGIVGLLYFVGVCYWSNGYAVMYEPVHLTLLLMIGAVAFAIAEARFFKQKG